MKSFVRTIRRRHEPTKSTHSDRLERWLGSDNVARVSAAMLDWYGPPIAVQGVPGAVYAVAGGDFIGHCDAGQFGSGYDRAGDLVRRWRRQLAARVARCGKVHHGQLNAGFASLSDLISEATTGSKRRTFSFNKAGSAGAVGACNSLWGLGNYPPAGANASAAPGGDATTSSTTGAWPFTNPTGGDTQHFTVGYPASSVVGNTLLLYDRLFQVNKTMNSTSAEAVTGVPTRYQSTTSTAAEYIGGNFIFAEVGGTALAATAHDWASCTYTDQASAASTLPTFSGRTSAVVRRLDHAVAGSGSENGAWFAPLATGDVGCKALTNIQCSALVATGVVNFVVGHPISWMPCPVVNLVCVADGLNTSFNLTQIIDSAALAFLEITKPSTTATNYNGMFETVSG